MISNLVFDETVNAPETPHYTALVTKIVLLPVVVMVVLAAAALLLVLFDTEAFCPFTS